MYKKCYEFYDLQIKNSSHGTFHLKKNAEDSIWKGRKSDGRDTRSSIDIMSRSSAEPPNNLAKNVEEGYSKLTELFLHHPVLQNVNKNFVRC
jgi:hypothetical protein